MNRFCVSFLPVSATFSALITTTKSPASRCGVKTGLLFPRSRLATCTASRPSTAPSASMTCHLRWSRFTFGRYVFIQTLILGAVKLAKNPPASRVILGNFGLLVHAGHRCCLGSRALRPRPTAWADHLPGWFSASFLVELLFYSTHPLQQLGQPVHRHPNPLHLAIRLRGRAEPLLPIGNIIHHPGLRGHGHLIADLQMRSEERRVGKECRSRWS